MDGRRASTAPGASLKSQNEPLPERLVAVEPSVTPETTGDDGLVLSLAGAWIVAEGKILETIAASLTSAARGASRHPL